MTDYLYYLLVGCGAGAIIAVFALGLVITHLGSGIVNFAHGATAMWITYVYADLRNGAYVLPIPGLPDRYHFGHDVGYRWALTLSMLTAVAIGLLEYLLVFRPLRTAPALAKVVASVGLLIVFTSLVEGRFADKITIRVNEILPKKSVTLAEGLTIPRDGLWLAVVALVITLLLWLLYRFTRFGLATRAAAECEKGAVLLGYSPDLLAGVNLVIATVVAGLIGILASPLLQLSASIYTFGFLIPALGAALIGRFRHFWPTLLTALAIGMTQSMFTKLQNDLSWFPKYGAREGLPFLIIIATMVLLGERLPGRGNTEATKLPTVPLAKITPFAVVVPAIAGVIGLLVLGPLWRAAIMTTLIAAVLALSNVVLTGFAGQTSLSQLAFAGVAGFSLAKLATHAHVPFPLAPLLAVVGAGVLGTLVGLPALRVRGTNLAIVTLAGGVAIAEFVFKNPAFVGSASTGGAKIGNPKLGPWEHGAGVGNEVLATDLRHHAAGRARRHRAGCHQLAPEFNRSPDAGRALQRTGCCCRWNQRRPHQTPGVRHLVADRRYRGHTDRVPLR